MESNGSHGTITTNDDLVDTQTDISSEKCPNLHIVVESQGLCSDAVCRLWDLQINSRLVWEEVTQYDVRNTFFQLSRFCTVMLSRGLEPELKTQPFVFGCSLS